MYNSLWRHELYSPWDSWGQNTGVGSLFLLQGIFPSQVLSSGLLYDGQILYQWATREALGKLFWKFLVVIDRVLSYFWNVFLSCSQYTSVIFRVLRHVYYIIFICIYYKLLWLSGKESASTVGDARDMSSIPGSGRSPGVGNPLQYSCLKNSMDSKAWGLKSMGLQRAGHSWAYEPESCSMLLETF